MAPAPLCKTAIVSFLINKETVPKLWNLSSNMRKRMSMVMEEMKIIVREYNENILKINGWVRIGRNGIDIESIEDMKKGVSNYNLETQEQSDKVIALNGKLRCYRLNFQSELPLTVDYMEYLSLTEISKELYSNCSFNKGGYFSFSSLQSSQIKDFLSRFKQIKQLDIKCDSISALDLRSLKIGNLGFANTTFTGKVELPFNLECLDLYSCRELHFLKCNKLDAICSSAKIDKELCSFIQSCKGLKEVNIKGLLVNFIDYIPSTVRILGDYTKFGSKKKHYFAFKKKLPFLIKVVEPTPIEAAQILNLRSVCPRISEAEEKLTIRPREIKIDYKNAKELNKRPELFEKVERMIIWTNSFKYDCLPDGVKNLCFGKFSIEGRKLKSLDANNWKFENSVIDFRFLWKYHFSEILNSLGKVRQIKILSEDKILIKYYPQFRFVIE